MTRKHDEVLDRLTRLAESVSRIERSIERIEVATIVRDPTSPLSADAYEGLRRQVVAAAGERAAHLHQLARFAQAVTNAEPGQLTGLVSEWMGQANLVRVEDPHDDRHFDILGGEGDLLRTVRPAYVDATTGRTVITGQAERVAVPDVDLPAEEPTTTDGTEPRP
jgi:hypothetical protein